MIGYTHVVRAETVGKGVLAYLHYSARLVEAHNAAKIFAKILLFVRREGLLRPVGSFDGLCRNLLDKGYKPLAQGVEEPVVLCLIVMRLVHIQQYVVAGKVVRLQPLGLLAAVVDDFFQIRTEQLEVVLILRLDVHGIRLAGQFAVGGVFVRRNLFGVANGLVRHFYLVAQHVVQAVALRVQRRNRLLEFGVGHKLIGHFRYDCHLFGIRHNALLRRVRFHIPTDKKTDVIESDNLSSLLHEKNIVRLDVDEVAILLDEVESGEKLTKRQQAYHEKTKVRDLAILTLMLGTGIRVSECVGLDMDDVDFKNNGIKIHRKGGKEVIVYFGEEVCEALLNYMEERENITPVEGHANALFLSMQNKRISVRSVENLVKKYSKLVTNLKNITPHKLRSTYGTNLYRETGDIYLVADVLGHKDVNTTKKHYAALEDERRRTAAKYVRLREKRED